MVNQIEDIAGQECVKSNIRYCWPNSVVNQIEGIAGQECGKS